LASSFLTGLAFGAFRLLFNFYVISLGHDEAFIGTLQTAEALAAILIALPAAYFADRFSQKKLLIGVSVIASIALVGVVLFPLAITLFVFRMGFGMAVAARQVIIAPFLMTNTSTDERQWVFSFNLGLMMTAMFVGNTIGGSLPSLFGHILGAEPTSTIAYQFALGTLGLVALLAVIPLFAVTMRRNPNQAPAELPWHLLRVHGRTLIPYFIPNLIIGLGAGLMQPFMNIYFRNVYGQPDPVIGVVFAVGGISMAIAQFIAPPFADARGKIDAVILTQALSIPFLLLLGIGAYMVPSGLGNAGLWFVIAAVAYNFRLGLMNMGNPIYQIFMLEHVPEDVQALAISLSSISFQFGWFIMPQVSGQLQVRFGDYGFVPIFFTVAFFYATAIVTQIYFFKRRKIGA
jgi:MFS family permease